MPGGIWPVFPVSTMPPSGASAAGEHFRQLDCTPGAATPPLPKLPSRVPLALRPTTTS